MPGQAVGAAIRGACTPPPSDGARSKRSAKGSNSRRKRANAPRTNRSGAAQLASVAPPGRVAASVQVHCRHRPRPPGPNAYDAARRSTHPSTSNRRRSTRTNDGGTPTDRADTRETTGGRTSRPSGDPGGARPASPQLGPGTGNRDRDAAYGVDAEDRLATGTVCRSIERLCCGLC